MKKSLKKIIQVSSAIFITWIVVYGIVYAELVSCSTIVENCIATSDRVLVGNTNGNFWTSSSSHQRKNQLRSNFCSKNILAGCGSENTCCERDRCVNYNQANYFNLTYIKYFYPLQKDVSSFGAVNDGQTAFEPYYLSISLKAVPIYILTQSIIC